MNPLSALLACCLALSTAGQLQPRCATPEECRLMAREHRRQRRALERRAPSPTLTTVYSTCPAPSQTTTTYTQDPATADVYSTRYTNFAPDCRTVVGNGYSTSTIPVTYSNSVFYDPAQSRTFYVRTTVTQTLPAVSPVTSTVVSIVTPTSLPTVTIAAYTTSTLMGSNTCFSALSTSTHTDTFASGQLTTLTQTNYACPTPTLTV